MELGGKLGFCLYVWHARHAFSAPLSIFPYSPHILMKKRQYTALLHPSRNFHTCISWSPRPGEAPCFDVGNKFYTKNVILCGHMVPVLGDLG